ncbi:MAG: dihydropteroate synthase [Betaproteobacteria bacterium]|nr:dihydropteroate synthase [Betaproteobacteria bacterium]NBY04526.1 dihydropteroate synthase [Betaproteobacteria bacterium]
MGLRPHASFWQTTRFRLDLSKPLVMGIVNVTPDSFSDGGQHADGPGAIAHAERLVREGADLLDIGGESSRPGAAAVDAATEWGRIQGLVEEVVRWNLPISIDTCKPEVMRAALDAGADIINDIWALRWPGAAPVVAAHGQCGVCLMHMHAQPASMQVHPMVGQAFEPVRDFLQHHAQRLQALGVDRERIVLDPGIGFGKTVAQNFELLARQSELLALGHGVLAGWSRKSALGAITGLDLDQRLAPSLAAAVLTLERGARVLRVHDVAQTLAAVKVWQAARPQAPIQPQTA